MQSNNFKRCWEQSLKKPPTACNRACIIRRRCEKGVTERMPQKEHYEKGTTKTTKRVL